MRSVLALVLAVAMIAGALVIRGGRGGDAGLLGGDDTLSVVCASELEAACRALGDDVEVVVEPAGVTAASLSAADATVDADAWLTLAPWPEIVAGNRQRAGLDTLSDTAPTPGANGTNSVGSRRGGR